MNRIQRLDDWLEKRPIVNNLIVPTVAGVLWFAAGYLFGAR